MTVESLVNRAKIGNVDAFTDLVGRYQRMAFAYAYSVIRDYQLAEDATQQAFITAYRNLESLRDARRFGGWLRGIVRYESLRVVRDQSQIQGSSLSLSGAFEPADPASNVSEEVEARDDLRNLIQGMEGLSDRHRAVAQLYYLADQPQSVVASFLGISVSAVNNRLREARDILRKQGVFPVNPKAFSTPNFSESVGRVIRSEGQLVDVKIANASRPRVLTSVSIKDADGSMNAFVAQYISDDVARLIVNDGQDAPQCVDAEVKSTGTATSAVLSTKAIDQLMHSAPKSDEQSTTHTGIKVVDLFATLKRNGIAAVVGESNVGKLVVVDEICARLEGTQQNLTLLVFLASPAEVESIYNLDVQYRGDTTVILVPVVDASIAALESTLDTVDSVIVMSENMARQGYYPAIDPVESRSKMDQSGEIGFRARQVLQESGERTALLSAYLSQPFYVAEEFTGMRGESVTFNTLLEDIGRILDGDIDGLQPELLMMTGALPS